jgi:TonB family protein
MKLKLTWLAAFSVVLLGGTVAVADTQKRGSATITYREPPRNEWYDLAPLPVGGIAQLVSHLYYPPGLRWSRSTAIKGSTYVIVRVDKHGRVKSVTFSPRMNAELEEIVIEAVHACRWNPGKRHGLAIDGAVRIPINFSLSKT